MAKDGGRRAEAFYLFSYIHLALLRFVYHSMHQFYIKINNFFNYISYTYCLLKGSSPHRSIFTTRRISTEESKKANSDVPRTPKIWHRNNKNHKHSHVTMVYSKKFAVQSLKNLMMNQSFGESKQAEHTNSGFTIQLPALGETDPVQFTPVNKLV